MKTLFNTVKTVLLTVTVIAGLVLAPQHAAAQQNNQNASNVLSFYGSPTLNLTPYLPSIISATSGTNFALPPIIALSKGERLTIWHTYSLSAAGSSNVNLLWYGSADLTNWSTQPVIVTSNACNGTTVTTGYTLQPDTNIYGILYLKLGGESNWCNGVLTNNNVSVSTMDIHN